MVFHERMAFVKEKKASNEWISWIKAIVIALLVAFILRSFVFATSIVEGESMVPALDDGERIIFNKLIYNISSPSRGDIVIIQHPDKNYVKRIIGLPNEQLEIHNNVLYIDGNPKKTSFVDEQNEALTGNFGPISIPAHHYFVMGDNRAVSKDSRNGLGLIEQSDIIGKSEFVIYPFRELQLTR